MNGSLKRQSGGIWPCPSQFQGSHSVVIRDVVRLMKREHQHQLLPSKPLSCHNAFWWSRPSVVEEDTRPQRFVH
jgi:hypothetical protein